MRAAQLIEPRKFQLVDVEKPKAGEGQALVRLKEIAVCGSDLIKYLGTLERECNYPERVGRPAHECVGIIEESSMDGYEKGDRVLLFPPAQNGLQEYEVADSPERLLKLPADGDISEWMMAQLLGTVLHGLRAVGEVLSEHVAIVGQGPVGQLFNHMMWNLGAQSVIGIDRVPERLAISPQMKATHTILTDNRDEAIEKVKELTGGRGADVVVEASGYDEPIRMAYGVVRQNGRLLQFGAPKHAWLEFAVRDIYDKRLNIVSTVGPERERDIGQALRYIIDGRVNVKPIITHRFPLDRVQEAYELFAERKDGCVKVVVQLD